MNTIKVPRQVYREAAIEKDGDSFSMSISSDEPYKRYDYWNQKEYWEVIDHEPGGIDEARLKAGLPILFNHDRGAHLATAKNYSIQDGKCVVRNLVWSSSALAQEKKKDAESGALTTTSVGYQILGEGEEVGKKDGLPIYKFRVEIFEGSLVTIPADITVGVGRTKDTESEPLEVKILRNEKKGVDETQYSGDKRSNMDAEKLAELETSLKTEKERADQAELALKDAKEAHEKALKEAKDAGEKAVKDAREKAEKDAVASERQRVAGINEYADGVEKAHGFDLSEARKSHIADGKTQQEFEKFVSLTKFCAKPLPTGGNESEGKKSMKMEDFRKLSPLAQRDYCLSGGKLTD